MGLDETSVSRANDENFRLQVVESFDIDQLRSRKVFDQQVQSAADICRAPVASIALIDRTHVRKVSTVGTDPGDCPREGTLCSRVVRGAHRLILEDVASQPVEQVASGNHDQSIGFYFGQPLMVDHSIAVGTLSVVDFEPRRLSARHRARLSRIARQIELQLEYILRKDASIAQAGLAAEVAVTHHVGARRQAVTNFLLHEVINAATALKADSDYVRARLPADSAVAEAVDDIADSVEVMSERLHSAREVLLDPTATLVSIERDVDLVEVVDRLAEVYRGQLSAGGGRLEVVTALDDPYVVGDRRLLEEMFESLIGATLAAATEDATSHIRLAEADPQTVEIVYRDGGDDRSDTFIRRLNDQTESFGPSLDEAAAAVARDSVEGLALCHMIVEAHGGTMSADGSRPDGRCFRIHLPH